MSALVGTPVDQDPIDQARLMRAHHAVFVVFAACGASFASWSSRIPDITSALHLTPGELGTVLLMAALGSVLSLPMSGRLIQRLGARRAVRLGSSVMLVGLWVAVLGVEVLPTRYLVMSGLFVLGLGMGVFDVSMNHEGAAVEQRLSHTVMPWYHAMFSAATVVAALLGSAATAGHVPVWLHVGTTVTLSVGACWWGTRHFLPQRQDAAGHPSHSTARVPGISPWREPRTLMIGLVVFAAAFTEGTANDWIAVAFVSGHELPAWAGVLALACFLGFMTIGRILGAGALDRYGRVPVLRMLFAVAMVGSVLVVFGSPVLAFIGTVLWGVGASLGFPVGISAASDDPRHAAVRLSTVSTIGYLAFLGGPPLVGYLGDHVGVLHALLAVAALLVPAFLVLPAVKELRVLDAETPSD